MAPEDIRRLEGKVDKVSEDVTNLRLLVENRVSVLETKSGLWGVLGGIVGGLLTGLKVR